MKAILSIEEVAGYLRFSVKKIYRLVEANQIPASRIGRQYRFMKESIDRWLREKEIPMRPNWDKRLDAVLARMRTRAGTQGIKEEDIEQEIQKVRRERVGNT